MENKELLEALSALRKVQVSLSGMLLDPNSSSDSGESLDNDNYEIIDSVNLIAEIDDRIANCCDESSAIAELTGLRDWITE